MLIDFHYHLADDPNALGGLLSDMDKASVNWTVLLGGPEEAFWDFLKCRFAGNDAIFKAVAQYPQRLVGSVYLDPRDPGAVDEFERYMDKGFRAVKMFPAAGYYPDDEMCFPLYEKIEAGGVPVLFHAGQTNIKLIGKEPGVRKATNSKYGNPMNFDAIARLFPKMPIVLAHMAYPHYIEAWSVAHANRNVYLDISGSGPWTEGISIAFNALGGHSFIPVDFGRVIWGSDNCLPQAEHIARSEVYMRQMGAGVRERKLIFGETAQRLLGLN